MLAIQIGNHNFGTTSHCRVPLRKRSAHQRIAPDIQTGCISCCSGDGRFGGPIWWNTPMEDEEATAEDNRTIWKQPHEEELHDAKRQKIEKEKPDNEEEAGDEEEHEEALPVPAADEDEIPEEVKQRLAVLKKSLGHAD